MKKYQAAFYGGTPVLKRVEVVRETAKCVYTNDALFRESKRAKESSCEAYFDTQEDAREWIKTKILAEIERAEHQIKSMQKRVELMGKELAKIPAMEVE
jgi:hypothetical protein